MSSLKEVFSRIQSAGLRLNPHKCHLARDHVVFLGHVVSQKGLQPDPKNTEKVLSWPVPHSPSEVRAFVGLCSYYRRFVKDFSKLAAPLNKLVGKNVPFVWNATCDQSFNHLKNVLSSEPVVIMPDFSVPFKIYTDASNLAVGAVLAQDRDGCKHVGAYASRALNSTQKRWSTFDRELWANVWAVREFKHYIGLASFHYFTKFVNLYPLPNQSAQTVAHCLVGDYVLFHGIPETLHTDQGRQFEAEVVQTLCRLLKIKKTHTTPYHPQSDGMVERFNRTLIDQLAKTPLTYGGEWDDYVKHVAFAYNTTTHSALISRLSSWPTVGKLVFLLMHCCPLVLLTLRFQYHMLSLFPHC